MASGTSRMGDGEGFWNFWCGTFCWYHVHGYASERTQQQHLVISSLVRSAHLALPDFQFYIFSILSMHGLSACVESAKNPVLWSYNPFVCRSLLVPWEECWERCFEEVSKVTNRKVWRLYVSLSWKSFQLIMSCCRNWYNWTLHAGGHLVYIGLQVGKASPM